ncbi:MAG: 30S ribosome-binding factor RbfA, partial [Anaeromyxobacteraceae bacterium]
MATHERPARVAHEFQRELGEVLARGLKDPRVTGFITVTGAKMSPDLKEVTVYVSVHGDDATRATTMEGLRAAAGYLQREVARRVKL